MIAVTLLAIAIVRLRSESRGESVADAARAGSVRCSQVSAAFSHQRSSIWLTLSAPVFRLLPDSDGRLRHQRFLVTCPSGMNVLIVNDISIGERAPVTVGASVTVRGQYIWNSLGGLVHFTHHAQSGTAGGWVFAAGKVYQ